MVNKKFWKWRDIQKPSDEEGKDPVTENVLILNGPIAEESWFDDEVTPADFKDELEQHKGPITLWINSPGGDCIAAAQIYNMLREHKGAITVKVDGIAASAASVVAMAGDKVLMSPVSLMMIHNPSTIAMGDKDEMQKVIDTLEAVKDSIMNAYELKTGLRRNKISELMDAESWFDAKTALDLGFCDGIITREEQNVIEDSLDPQMFQKKVSETNLTNKLREKYLIKKEPESTPTEPVSNGVHIDVINMQLETMKKYM